MLGWGLRWNAYFYYDNHKATFARYQCRLFKMSLVLPSTKGSAIILRDTPYQRLGCSTVHFRLCLRASCFCYCYFILYWHLSLSSSPGSMESPGETPREPRVSFFRPSKAFLCVSGIMIAGISRSKSEKVKLVILPCLECWGFMDRIRGQLWMGGDLSLQFDPVVASSECTFGYLYLIYSVLLFSKNTKT